MKQDKKTNQQNKAYWLFQEMIADEMSTQWITLDKLVIEIQPKATSKSLHEVFKAISDKMYQKDSTTLLSREEMQSILDVYMIALSSIWIHFEFPSADRNNLLQFYK